MPAIFPATEAERWAEAVTLRPAGGGDPDNIGVPRFALIEIRGPDPRALLSSTALLAGLVSLSVVLGRVPNITRAPSPETVTLLVAPPEWRIPPGISTMKNFIGTARPLPQTPERAAGYPPVLASAKPLPAPLKVEPPAPALAAAEPLPPEPMKTPPAIPLPAERAAVKAAPAVAPAAKEASPPNPGPATPGPSPTVVPHHLVPGSETSGPARVAARDFGSAGPGSLGGLPLSQLLEDQAGLAAGFAALPTAARLSLPRVSIRVNTEWLAALPKTQERLYFSVTAPEADREVLAYVPGTQRFDLERPAQPLWQIHEGERVPALAELRASAARWLGVPPTLVGLYTWHPPVLENALQMFVLERMQELHVRLGPRDIVTVRLASGAAGAVMNLEPLREDASP